MCGPSAVKMGTDFLLEKDDKLMMHCFKVLPCSKRHRHDWKKCPYAHPTEKARRRDPLAYEYLSVFCPEEREGMECPRGDRCPLAHNVFEFWLHPSRYKTVLCKDLMECKRGVCFFAHSTDQLRKRPILQQKIPHFGNEHGGETFPLATSSEHLKVPQDAGSFPGGKNSASAGQAVENFQLGPTLQMHPDDGLSKPAVLPDVADSSSDWLASVVSLQQTSSYLTPAIGAVVDHTPLSMATQLQPMDLACASAQIAATTSALAIVQQLLMATPSLPTLFAEADSWSQGTQVAALQLLKSNIISAGPGWGQGSLAQPLTRPSAVLPVFHGAVPSLAFPQSILNASQLASWLGDVAAVCNLLDTAPDGMALMWPAQP